MKSQTYGVFGGFSGRLGNVIAYNWRGRCCVRSMPSHYHDARSEAQLTQRAMFKYVVGFAAKARQVLKLGLRSASLEARMSESNYFMRINKGCFANAGMSAEDVPVVDYQRLVVADGPVAPVAFAAPRWLDEATLSVAFEKNPLRRVAKSEDLVYIAAYCPELGDFDLSLPAYRRSNTVTFSLNRYWVGREVHLWGFVVDEKGRASSSQYIGAVGTGIAPEAEDEVPLPGNGIAITLSAAGCDSGVTSAKGCVAPGDASLASPHEARKKVP